MFAANKRYMKLLILKDELMTKSERQIEIRFVFRFLSQCKKKEVISVFPVCSIPGV
jgi:hypothetical protein